MCFFMICKKILKVINNERRPLRQAHGDGIVGGDFLIRGFLRQ